MSNKKENKKNEREEKIDSQINIQSIGHKISANIKGSPVELANLLANVFEYNNDFFVTVKSAVEAWDETEKIKEKPFDELLEVLLEKLEELKILTRKIH